MPSHRETRTLPYTPEQVFDLVADVERYPEFLPWCVGARVRERSESTILADLMIGFKMIRERYTSRVVLDRPNRIDVEYGHEGPFRHLENQWAFKPAPGGCEVEFFLDFEFKSRMLQRLIGVLFQEAVRRMVSAFEARARALYGAPAKNNALNPSAKTG
jgi:coenzyme Q-binding protein COQ10